MDQELKAYLDQSFQQLREESARQFRQVREETAQQFQEVAQQFRQIREDTAQQFQQVREETAQQLQQVRKEAAQQLQEVARQIQEDTAHQFRQVREEMSQRFEKVDQRLDDIETDVRRAYVTVEDLRGEVRQVAEGVAGNTERLERLESGMSRELGEIRSFNRLSYRDLDARGAQAGIGRVVAERRSPSTEPLRRSRSR